jgi:translation initiation factor 1
MLPAMTGDSRLVYSTDGGRSCPDCRRPLADCRCRAAAAAAVPAGDGIARVSREKQGRGGKTVTVVRGLPLAAEPLAALGKRLRSACGTGGTAKDGVLELQGDQVERVLALLAAEGYRTRRSGG